MNLQSGPEDGPQHLYKWFLDANKDASVKGTSIEKYEYLVVYRDQKIYLCDSSDDKLSKCSQITDQNILDYRKTGNYLDISIKLANVGGVVKSVWWITDSNENNLNQQSNGNKDDWPDFGGTDIPFIPIPYCGDGTVNSPSEQCDDGNNISGDGCSAICTSEVCTPGETASCDTGELGVCAVGTKTCNDIGAWGNCVRNTNPSAEVCDNLDNDCDGETDEDLTQPTSNQYGLCAGNIEICEAGQWVPSPNNYTPTDEVCEGQLDEDCDGTVDEGCSCTNGETRQCGQTDVGECSYGTQTCENGQWGECVGAVYPSEEICDGLDNDCDGTIDNDNVCSTNYYCDNDSDSYISSSISGSCNEYDCVPGDCSTEPGNDCDDDDGNINPGATEICNGVDDDCDGNIDEDDVCPSIYGVKCQTEPADEVCDDNNFKLTDWLIELYKKTENEYTLFATTTTGEGGSYQFSNLLPGDYKVCEEVKNGWQVVFPENGCEEITLSTENVVVDFGNYFIPPTGTIYGVKFNDLNNNTVKDEGEPGLADWIIFLEGEYGNGIWEEGELYVITDENGYFEFSNVPLGTYIIREVLKENWTCTLGCGTQIGIQDGDEIEINIGNHYISETAPLGFSGGGGGTVYYGLSVSKTGNGSGNVSANIGGINCGTSCSDSYLKGSTVTLTATPDANSKFDGWSGHCSGTNNTCTLDINDYKSVIASFSVKGEVAGESSEGGEVLGEEAEKGEVCSIYLFEYIKYGAKNNPEEVKKLQLFLNEEMGANLPITGIYDWATMQWVNKFQLKYKEEVLRPWVQAGLHSSEDIPTGYVYKTTKRWINMIKCPSLNLPLPDLSEDRAKILGTGERGQESEVLGEETSPPPESEEKLEEVVPSEESVSAPAEGETKVGEEKTDEKAEKKFPNWLIILLIIALLVIGFYYYFKGRKKTS